jgi:squalene-hopene/tetraprenyl-beta-curcumene cyclase
MAMNLSHERINAAFDVVQSELLDEIGSQGHWTGELSTSALSTATAAFALTMVDRARGQEPGEGSEHEALVRGGLDWLAKHVNADGGWGDTLRSHSNPSTTTLCWAALGTVPGYGERYCNAHAGAVRWLGEHVPSFNSTSLAEALVGIYGDDRTFSVPILTMCALAGCLGDDHQAWRHVIPLPFELAAMPHSWYRYLGIPVVSYALPALIAVGQVRHRRCRDGNPLRRFLRNRTISRTLRTLESIQPESGGFLEAVPLTSFVAMSLAGCGEVEQPSVHSAVKFLRSSVRSDGSWPIDSNLATWLTTLSINALSGSATESPVLGDVRRDRLIRWLLDQQYRERHPYTNAAPGGWAWTDLPGGVPDADDTAGALLALRALHETGTEAKAAAGLGIQWLLDLQNRDGGTPTFCRGWGKLPFDRSSPDLTAHFLRAAAAWRADLARYEPGFDRRIGGGVAHALRYLSSSQRDDGAWAPLWFGHQDAPAYENLTYGTGRVVTALREAMESGGLLDSESRSAVDRARRGIKWILGAQNSDGGWGGQAGIASSVEETALAVESLMYTDAAGTAPQEAVERGLQWLVVAVEERQFERPSPIGFYFANLWYYEKLYPLIFAAGALGRARRFR